MYNFHIILFNEFNFTHSFETQTAAEAAAWSI